MNRPSFQFYPQDWGDDPGLQMCSLEARGLWIEMMRIMHKGEPYGHLKLSNGASPIDMKHLALFVRSDPDTVQRAFDELDSNGVFSRTEGGVIYSRRMVRDEEGRKGTRQRVQKHRDAAVTSLKRECNGDVTSAVTQKKHRSSSSSSSSTSQEKEEEKKAAPKKAQPRLVHWDPKPRWKKDDPTHKDAFLRVDPGHFIQLRNDFPRVEGNGGGVQAEVLKMQRHALSNPSWGRKKSDWGLTLANWLKRADERFDDARFKANSRASPTADIIAWEAAKEAGRDRAAETAESIARCEKDNGPHLTAKLTQGSKTLYCGCGYYELRKDEK